MLDGTDNCQLIANAAQTNSDSGPPPPNGFFGDVGGWSNGPNIPGDDVTVANGALATPAIRTTITTAGPTLTSWPGWVAVV